ncbi:hypothetical protein [Actibacterium sp. 188UL27-1]|uniref:hypothetical protein n=1 Tax=Actibacterium sp. 188UL27-1 TaxID=2786961 RepID=UPI00195E968D|nr:hypothetical protein [Actibacterium sp. 188UL27-1]MBM7066584.1 hypothetical protein [Actibacterium sp. 188UL27-1]
MPFDATEARTDIMTRLGPKLAGFVFGVAVLLAAGGFVSVAFTGVGFGEGTRTPPQVYTSF